MDNIKRRNRELIIWLTVTMLALAAVFYAKADTISITAPPWNFCGFHETRTGTALSCIAFDVTPIVIK